MASVSDSQLISVADYLAGELASDTKHEYLGGVIYAMAGGRNSHNLIATRLTRLLFPKDEHSQCEPYNSDTKIRICSSTYTRFYYPDASVICKPNPPSDTFQDHPALVAEVVSRSTRRIDEGEKKDAYFTLPSLQVYLLIEQEQPLVTVHRRNEQGAIIREVFQGVDAVISLAEIGADLSLSDLYQGIELTPEDVDEEPR